MSNRLPRRAVALALPASEPLEPNMNSATFYPGPGVSRVKSFSWLGDRLSSSPETGVGLSSILGLRALP